MSSRIHDMLLAGGDWRSTKSEPTPEPEPKAGPLCVNGVSPKHAILLFLVFALLFALAFAVSSFFCFGFRLWGYNDVAINCVCTVNFPYLFFSDVFP